METLADRTIAQLRAEHDQLRPLLVGLNDDALTGPSGAAEWSVAQVASHLGSGAEITMAGLLAALGEAPPPADDFNQGVWDRWNAMPPRQQADESLARNAELIGRLEALDAGQRAEQQFPLGFAPAPLSAASFAGLRLNEFALHSWDIRVALDPSAGLSAQSADVLLEHFAGALGFLLGFIAKPAAAGSAPVVVKIDGSSYGLAIDDAVSIVATPAAPTATFAGAPEAAVRLLAGRLGPAYTPADSTVTGNITLDELRAVFPGF